MVRILVLDRSAESRRALYDWLSRLVAMPLENMDMFPRVSLDTVSIDELRFQEQSDLCIIGPEFLEYDLKSIAAVRAAIKETPILAILPPPLRKLNMVEQIIRLGASDVLGDNADAHALYQKLIILPRRSARKNHGHLIVVDSAKGGSGVTSIVAALGEVAASAGRKVCLVDFDFETQDLSRFLQARPFVNENLVQLIYRSRAVSEESLRQCVGSVWGKNDNFVCMSPVPESELVYDSDSGFSRTLAAVLGYLNEMYDAVIVDMGCLRGAAVEALYARANRILFVVQNDASSFYASVEKVSRVLSRINPDCTFSLLENNHGKNGLRSRFMREQFELILRIENSAWQEAVPNSAAGSRWPASGSTLFSCGAAAAGALVALASNLSILPEQSPASVFRKIKDAICPGSCRDDMSEKAATEHLALMPAGESLRRALPGPAATSQAGLDRKSLSDSIDFQIGDAEPLVSGIRWVAAENNSNVNDEQEDICQRHFA